MTDSDAECDAILAELERAGLVEEYDQVDAKPRTRWLHTPRNRVGAGVTPAPPTPPDMRVRIRRFASAP